MFLDIFCSWPSLFTESGKTISTTFLWLSNRYIKCFRVTSYITCICVDFYVFVCFHFALILVLSCLSYVLLSGSSLYFRLLKTSDSAACLFCFLCFFCFFFHCLRILYSNAFSFLYFYMELPICQISFLSIYFYRMWTASSLNLFCVAFLKAFILYFFFVTGRPPNPL